MGRKKILILFTDQWRWDAISGLGGTVAKTPNVDRLLARGTVFRNHYSVCVPCGPSRASFLTGLYAMTHRSVTNGTPLDDRFDNLALAVRRHGVEPLLVGYTTTTPDPRSTTAHDPRFQVAGDVMAGFKPLAPYHAGQDTYRAELKSKGYDVSDMDQLWRPEPRPLPPGRGLSWPPSRLSTKDADNAFYTDQALKHLAVREDRDWLMLLTYMRPHPPFVAPAPWHDMFDPADMPAPRRAASLAEEAAQHPYIAHLLKTTEVKGFIPQGTGLVSDLSDLDVAQTMATYFGMISELDHQIGRVLDHLEATGEIDETLIIFTSDHGELLGDHYMFGKAGPFEGSFRIPLILAEPGGTARTVDAFTESVDILPTILDWIGAPRPRACDGRSLLPWVRGAAPAVWRDGVMLEFDLRNIKAPTPLGLHPDEGGAAIWRDETSVYIHYAGLPPMSYDLSTDPHELRPLDRSPEQAMARLLTRRISHAERTLTGFQAGPGGLARL